MKNAIKLFEDKTIRTQWDKEREEWYFSVVDVIAVLSESERPRKYWSDLKIKLNQEGSELSDKIVQLKMQSSDGKYYNTDVLDTKGVLRLIQSIPSPNAEPFKMWLAEVGSERLNEIADPELAIKRGYDTYRKKGYPEGWINQRKFSIDVRNELTDEWRNKGITEDKDYAILTNEITKSWSGKSIKEYKEYKELKKENLRDNMTNIELVLNMLAEATTTAISKNNNPQNMEDNIEIARIGGSVAKDAKNSYEAKTGLKAISKLNAKNKELLNIKEENK